jgi:hypothetical protein
LTMEVDATSTEKRLRTSIRAFYRLLNPALQVVALGLLTYPQQNALVRI